MRGKTLALEVRTMKLRKWSADEKLAIVMEGLKEKRSVSEICREHKISQTLYYRWRDKFLEGGKRALVNGASDDNGYKAEIEKLQKIIGKQAIQIEILKKTEELFGKR
jgi:transposase-like protein